MVTQEIANAGKGANKGGKSLAHFPFPVGTFDVLPKAIEKGADGRAARTEWNLEGLKLKQYMVVPRDRLSAASAAIQNTVKRTMKEGKKTLRFITTAVTHTDGPNEGQPIMEDVPQFDKAGKPIMKDGKQVIKSLPKSYYIVRVPLAKS